MKGFRAIGHRFSLRVEMYCKLTYTMHTYTLSSQHGTLLQLETRCCEVRNLLFSIKRMTEKDIKFKKNQKETPYRIFYKFKGKRHSSTIKENVSSHHNSLQTTNLSLTTSYLNY